MFFVEVKDYVLKIDLSKIYLLDTYELTLKLSTLWRELESVGDFSFFLLMARNLF